MSKAVRTTMRYHPKYPGKLLEISCQITRNLNEHLSADDSIESSEFFAETSIMLKVIMEAQDPKKPGNPLLCSLRSARFLIWESDKEKGYKKECPLIFGSRLKSDEVKLEAAAFLTYITISNMLVDKLRSSGKEKLSGLVRNVADEHTKPTVFHFENGKKRLFRGDDYYHCFPTNLGDGRTIKKCSELFNQITRKIKDKIDDPENCEAKHANIMESEEVLDIAQKLVESLCGLPNGFSEEEKGMIDGIKTGWEGISEQLPLIGLWLRALQLHSKGCKELWVFPSPSNMFFNRKAKFHGAIWMIPEKHSPSDFLGWQIGTKEVFLRGFWLDMYGDAYRERIERDRQAQIGNRLDEVRELLNQTDTIRQNVEQGNKDLLRIYYRAGEILDPSAIQGDYALRSLAKFLRDKLFMLDDRKNLKYKELCNALNVKTVHNLTEWNHDAINKFRDSSLFNMTIGRIKTMAQETKSNLPRAGKWITSISDNPSLFQLRHIVALKSLSKYGDDSIPEKDRDKTFSLLVLEILLGINVICEENIQDTSLRRYCVLKKKSSPIDICRSFLNFSEKFEIKLVKEQRLTPANGGFTESIIVRNKEPFISINWQATMYSKKMAKTIGKGSRSSDLNFTFHILKDLGFNGFAGSDNEGYYINPPKPYKVLN